MFSFYQIKKTVCLSNMRLDVSLYVDCANKEADLRVMRDGRIMPRDCAQPKWWQIDTPAKAEDWFRRIDLDRLAERYYLESKAA